MSEHRSTSGQRFTELRAKFEQQNDQNLAPPRGQSPSEGHINSSSSSRSPSGRQVIKTSFVAVEPTGQTPPTMASNGTTAAQKAASIANRRPSFSYSTEQDSEAINELKETVSQEAERRKSMPGLKDQVVPETAVVSAMPTPIIEAAEPVYSAQASPRPATSNKHTLQSANSPEKVALPVRETQSEHTEKPRSAVEDQEADLRPADVTTSQTITGNDPVPAIDGQAEQGQHEASRGEIEQSQSGTTVPSKASTTKKVKTRPAAPVSAARSTAASSSRVSLAAGAARPSASNKPATSSTRTITTNRSSLSSKSSSQGQQGSPPSKAVHRAPTQIVPLPSHLTAPTASSKAKHESEHAATRRVTSGSRPITNGSHLIAPTASSKAKHEAEEAAPDRATSGSKPLASLSHLLAPTASSKAKHEPENEPEPAASSSRRPAPAPVKRDRTSMASATNAARTSRLGGRQSLAGRPNGPSNQASQTKPAAAPARTAAPGFLERMMKPTAASSSKVHDKLEESAVPSTPTSRNGKSSVVQRAKEAVGKALPNGTATEASTTNGLSETAQSSKEKSTATTTTMTTEAGEPALSTKTPIVNLASSSTSEAKSFTRESPINGTANKLATTNGHSKTAKQKNSPKPANTPDKPAQTATKPSAKPSAPSTPASTSKAAPVQQSSAAAHQPTTPVVPAASLDGQTEVPWCAAALPSTPQSQRKAVGQTNGSLPSSEAREARRSLMETPNLLGTTIH